MKVEGALFSFVALFLGASTVVYWFTSHDPTGTTALALSTGLGSIIATYLVFTGRRIGLRPEDRTDSEIAEAAGDVGFFSPYSYWPLPLAGGAAVVVLGFVFGYWLAVLGFVLLLYSLTGFLLEYYVTEQH